MKIEAKLEMEWCVELPDEGYDLVSEDEMEKQTAEELGVDRRDEIEWYEIDVEREIIEEDDG